MYHARRRIRAIFSVPRACGNADEGTGPVHIETPPEMATDKELASFLAAIERRAFKQTMFAVRNEENALDIVQNAMIKLAEKYGARPAAELPLLFARILRTTTLDFFRRNKVREAHFAIFSSLAEASDDDDPLERLEADHPASAGIAAESAETWLDRMQVIAAISAEIEKLPARQREAFLLRYWEDMDVAETAAVMGCSQGSVKTHCSRAVHALAAALQSKGITL